MRRIASLALILAALAASGEADFALRPAHAWLAQKAATVATSQVLSANTTGTLANTAVRYTALGYSAAPVSSDTQYTLFSVPGSITKLRMNMLTAPTSTATWTVELRKNGSNTGLTCTITSASSGKCSTTGSVSYAAGDYASLIVTPANTPTATVASISAVFVPTTANDTIMTGRAASFSTSSTYVGLPFSDQSPSIVSSRPLAYVPDGGTVDQLYVISTAPGSTGQTSKKYDWAISKSATTQTFVCSISADSTTCNDTSNSFSITGPSGATAGDSLTFPAAPSGTPTSVSAFGARYRPTTTGSFPLMVVFPSADSTSVAMYYPLSGGTSAGSTTEINTQSIADSMTVTKIAVVLNAAPGAGRSRAFTLRVNGADTACTVTISNTATSNSASCSVSIADNDLVATADVPTGTPAAATPAISYLANR